MRTLARNILRRAQRFRAASAPHGVILIYHRVASPLADPWNMSVSPQNFAAHLAVIKRFAAAKTMCDFADGLAHSHGPDRSIVVTFDDGYFDNLSTGLPIMQAFDIPATVFAISGAIGKPDSFWWDLLTRVFLETPHLPRTLSLEAGKTRKFLDLAKDADLECNALQQHADWRADWTAPKGLRQNVFLEIWQHMVSLSVDEKTETAREISAWAGLGHTPLGARDGRPMDHTELAQLTASSLIEIGGHTVNHSDLAKLPLDDALDEIAQDRLDLMKITGRPIDSFAYPYGRHAPHTPDQIREAGYQYAGCSHPGLATPASNVFALPRVQVPNLTGSEFETLLSELLGPPQRPRTDGDGSSESRWVADGAV